MPESFRISKSFALLTVLALSTPPLAFAANEINDSFSATYSASVDGIDAGTLSFTLRNTKGKYRVMSHLQPSSAAKAFGAGEERQISRFGVKNGHVLPIRFDEMKKGSDRGQWMVEFDWKKMTFVSTGSAAKKIPRKPVDAASALVQLMLTPPAPGRDLTLTMINDREIRPYIYSKVGEVQLKTNVGTVTADQIRQRKKGSPDDKYLDIWLSKDHGYVPVRFERHKSGRAFVIELSELKDQ